MASNPYLNIATILIGGAAAQAAKTSLLGDLSLKAIDYEDIVIDYSKLGTPIYSNLWLGNFNNPTYLDVNGVLKTYNPIIINCVLFNVTLPKNIVKTQINGRNGTFKEYISDGDFQIDARITIASMENKYPEEEVKALIALCQLPIPIPVNSWYLDMFGIENVVIDNYQIGQVEGTHNMQTITLSMSSDIVLELE